MYRSASAYHSVAANRSSYSHFSCQKVPVVISYLWRLRWCDSSLSPSSKCCTIQALLPRTSIIALLDIQICCCNEVTHSGPGLTSRAWSSSSVYVCLNNLGDGTK